MSDILFKTDDWIFSYRAAGILIHNGKVLLQKPTNDTGFAFPGGHVSFGETNAKTLIREFKEEIGANISVNELKWVAEIFFPWGEKPCHQICNYYLVTLDDTTQIPLDRMFIGIEQMNERPFNIEFHWIPIDNLNSIKIYPANAAELFGMMDRGVQHFVYREEI